MALIEMNTRIGCAGIATMHAFEEKRLRMHDISATWFCDACGEITKAGADLPHGGVGFTLQAGPESRWKWKREYEVCQKCIGALDYATGEAKLRGVFRTLFNKNRKTKQTDGDNVKDE